MKNRPSLSGAAAITASRASEGRKASARNIVPAGSSYTTQHLAHLRHRRDPCCVQLIQLSDVPKNGIQVPLHSRFFLGRQFQVRQLSDPPHVVNRYTSLLSSSRVVPLHLKVYLAHFHSSDPRHLSREL